MHIVFPTIDEKEIVYAFVEWKLRLHNQRKQKVTVHIYLLADTNTTRLRV